MKLPPAVKLLRSEVSPCGEVGKLNFTLCEAQNFTMPSGIASHRREPMLQNRLTKVRRFLFDWVIFWALRLDILTGYDILTEKGVGV